MIKYAILLLSCMTIFAAQGQSLKAYQKAGDKALAQGDFNAATYYYQYILKKDPNNRTAMFKYATCASQMYAYPIAEQYLLKIAKTKGAPDQFPDYALVLARTYRGQAKYQEAIKSYHTFLNTAQGDTHLAGAQKELEACLWAIEQKQGTETIVTNSGKGINSAFSDFAPSLLGDTLYYSSYRFKRLKNVGKPPKKWTKVLMSVKSSRAKEANRLFQSQDSVHIAHTAFFPSGRFMIYTECKDQATGIRCDLFLSVRDEKGKWMRGLKLPEGVNAAGFTTTQPNVSIDAKTGALQLFFASDRPGGLGQLDLYRMELDSAWFCPCKTFASRKAIDLPAFGKCQALTSLNTPYNDATPFYHQPSNMLWFASDGRLGFGGYDIYRAKPDQTGTENVVENVGLPFNSSYNDLYPLIDSAATNGYLTSNRLGSQYLNTSNKACCFDLYQWRSTEPQVPTPDVPIMPRDTSTVVVSIPPTTAAVPGKNPILAPPPITPHARLQTFVGLPLYFDNDEPDKRTKRATTSKTYESTALAYLGREEEYRARFAEGAKNEDARSEAEAEISDFFANEVRLGYDRLFELTDLIYERLQTGERIEVIIKGFTSPRAETDYNLQLGHRRISSVKNHFITWSHGALQSYLNLGQLVISETSFGETTASSQISDKINDEKNSIYHPIAARERRVEIIEIKSQ